MAMIHTVRKPVVFLMGPTASGKSSLALELAARFPAEIVNVDAAQVYRGLDIGTAKASQAERAAYPHHLIDIRDPDQIYSAAQFLGDALPVIDEIRARGRWPLVTGGTMFYFHTLIHGLPDAAPADARIRVDLETRARAQGWVALHGELAALDPRRAAEISPTDGQRIQRALEINLLTGRNVPCRAPLGKPRPPWPLIQLALAPALRESLHQRIDARFRAMLELGFIEEVQGLLERFDGLPEPAFLKMVGYRQVAEYLRGGVGYNRMLEAGLAATRRLAKRQLTWLRNRSAVTWIDSDRPGTVAGACQYLEAGAPMVDLPRNRSGFATGHGVT